MSQIFNITHDAGNLDEYTSTETDNSDLSAGPGLANTPYGLSCFIDDTNPIYGQKDFTRITADAYRFRFYIDPNTLSIDSYHEITVCLIRSTTGHLATIRLRYVTATGYDLRAIHQNDDYGSHATNYYPLTDAEHYIELLVTWATGKDADDATVTLWIDGDQMEQLTGLDIHGRNKADNARLGVIAFTNGNVAGTLYLDEFIFRDDGTEIGPALAPAGFALVF